MTENENSAESLVIGSKIKAYIKSKNMMCSGELQDAVSDLVRRTLDRACERTAANNRSTVRPCDL
ncbi:MAG: hypothetical protein ACT4PU_06610 [Planctomycetota bacterium]